MQKPMMPMKENSTKIQYTILVTIPVIVPLGRLNCRRFPKKPEAVPGPLAFKQIRNCIGSVMPTQAWGICAETTAGKISIKAIIVPAIFLNIFLFFPGQSNILFQIYLVELFIN